MLPKCDGNDPGAGRPLLIKTCRVIGSLAKIDTDDDRVCSQFKTSRTLHLQSNYLRSFVCRTICHPRSDRIKKQLHIYLRRPAPCRKICFANTRVNASRVLTIMNPARFPVIFRGKSAQETRVAMHGLRVNYREILEKTYLGSRLSSSLCMMNFFTLK